MRHAARSGFAALVLILALSGCGGGGAPSPILPSGSPPTNAGTPASVSGPTTFQAYSASMSENGGLTSTLIAGPSASNTVTVDGGLGATILAQPAGGGVSAAAFSETFTASDITAFGTSFVTYARSSGGQTESWTAIVGPEHTTFGYWERVTSTAYDRGFLLYGNATPSLDMPVTGSATYGGLVQGIVEDATGTHLATGSASMTANFGTGTVSLAFSGMSIRNLSGGASTPWDSFIGSGTITGGTNGFSGSLSSLDSSLTGSFQGGFHGPATPYPDEAGGVWSVGGAGETAVGAFVLE